MEAKVIRFTVQISVKSVRMVPDGYLEREVKKKNILRLKRKNEGMMD